MKRVNKFLYLFVVQGKYTSVYGWEDVFTAETYKEGRSILKDYRDNEPEYAHRLIRRRELNPEYKEE